MPSSANITRRRTTKLRGAKLCTRCSRLDFSNIFAARPLTARGRNRKILVTITKWSIGSCSLCTILAAAFPLKTERAEKEKLYLRFFSSREVQKLGWKIFDTAMITVHRSRPNGIESSTDFRFLVPLTIGTESVRTIEKDTIDFAVPRAWLQFCGTNHTKRCHLETLPDVPGLRFIDCSTRSIVQAKGESYVTLSYRWGDKDQGGSFNKTLPADIPLTIEDAITATQLLGFRYLWVDRYCINQQNEQEKIQQCARMDVIYSGSEITIIAAAGQDPSFGLPGISRRSRKFQQIRGKVDKYTLFSTLGNPIPSIESSAWMRRGWTYQEALLSRRRLVFTDNQLYFECCGMYCFESLNHPLEALHTTDIQHFKSQYVHNPKIGMFPRSVGSNAWDILVLIHEYTKKEFTNPTDILNAFLGILHRFEIGAPSVCHHWGIPILPPARRNAAKSKLDVTLQPWSPAIGFITGLSWTASQISRRHDFPSWSWTGWMGQCGWDTQESKWMLQKFDPAVKVGLELWDGSTIDIGEIESYRSKTPQLLQLSKAIHVTGWTTTIKIKARPRNHALSWRSSKFSYTGSIRIEGGQVLNFYFQPDDLLQVPPEVCIGLLLYQNRDSIELFSGIKGPQLLILGKIGDRLERIGAAKIDINSCEVYGEDGNCIFPVEDDEYGIPLLQPGPFSFQIPWNWRTSKIE
jgi:heterokaryon incompatibility protein (HET)